MLWTDDDIVAIIVIGNPVLGRAICTEKPYIVLTIADNLVRIVNT